MKMIPALKKTLWGGERLIKDYGKKTDMLPLAESWEVSCHPDGLSFVANGEFAGLSLLDVLEKHPEMAGFARPFPILLKLIDAGQSTSLQVHPPDAYAWEVEGQPGKNEMWFVLDAKPDTALLIGFKRTVSQTELRERMENGTLPEIMRSITVKPGDCFPVPAGMIHAIGQGALLAEVQQSSNITYRVFDYGRQDAAGNLRKLHTDKALDVIDAGLKAQNRRNIACIKQFDGHTRTLLTTWQWFKTDLLDIQSRAALANDKYSFSCILIFEGELTLEWDAGSMPLVKGESVFIPAGLGLALIGAGKALFIHM